MKTIRMVIDELTALIESGADENMDVCFVDFEGYVQEIS